MPLKRIGSLIGLDLRNLARAASLGEPMQAGHNVGGNRSTTLRPDAEEWKSAFSPKEKQLSWALMGWLMLRYGYER